MNRLALAPLCLARNEFDQTIQETEAAYMKVRWPLSTTSQHLHDVSCTHPAFQILESSQTLLNVLKRETVNLSKKRAVP